MSKWIQPTLCDTVSASIVTVTLILSGTGRGRRSGTLGGSQASRSGTTHTPSTFAQVRVIFRTPSPVMTGFTRGA